jgi:hypothetical protein
MEAGDFSAQSFWQRRLTNIFRHRGAVALWIFNHKFEVRLAARR